MMSGPIYTGRGDSGETSLVGGERVSKSSPRVAAFGTIDEANSAIGLVRASLQVTIPEEAVLDRKLHFVQHKLMNCASTIATPTDALSDATPTIVTADVERLESAIDDLLEQAGDAGQFVLPMGCEEAARCHLARTVVRRAERELVELDKTQQIDPEVLKFINRLSDLMFAAARYCNAVYGSGDVFWDPDL